jgi:phosphoglycerate dehydrogenase-like enzyme
MGVDTLYIVDTNGSFLPDEVFETISALTDKLDIKIGFHGHNNFSLAIANSLAAIEAGAVVVDASLKGIGRSAGNAQLEILVSILKRRGLIKKVVDLDALLIAADTIVLPIISAPKGMSSIEIITADGNIDVYPYSIYERVAYEAGLNFIDFIYALGRDKKTVEADMPSLKRVLARLKKDADLVLSKAGLIAAKEPPKRPRLRPKKKIVAALSLLTEAQHPYSFREEMASPLIKEFPGVDFRVTPIAELKGLEEAKILFSYALTQDMLSAMPMLKWFNSTVTGPDKVLFPEVIERRIKITTPRGLHSIPISETVVGLMLCLSRKLKECILSQSRGVYDPMAALGADPPMRELSGSTAVIIGLGGIGNAVAVRCKSLAMSVVAVVPSPRPSPSYVDVMLTKDRLCEALPAADFLILACPLTHETRGMIGKGELSSMKRDSFVINCARGELWDEGALMAALNSGAIGGAAADAFAMEPLPDGHPFFSTRNMIITPHVSGISTRYWGRTLSRFSENLRCYLNGEELIGLVDLKKGY